MHEEYLLNILNRKPVQISDRETLNYLTDKTVLVTGGGGFIGSEICRKVAECSPGKIVVVDIYENNAYLLQQELLRHYNGKPEVEIYITSVCDMDQLETVFANERPEVVIHAAAHKHVPLMEKVPIEAVKNNVFGTVNTVELCIKYGVERFVLISSDKAVNPKSVMGTTKRICEMIVQTADKHSERTRFTAVRFGNVIGSDGSVVPLFSEQIKSGTVTVTHPEMHRFFMTASEAAQLVLTAGVTAKGGEIFVLDMGEPVKIADIAKKMIELEGLEEGKDVNIVYTDLRPGEKLAEELLLSEEGITKTRNDKIFVAKPICINEETFNRQISELRRTAFSHRTAGEEIIKLLHDIVPEYK